VELASDAATSYVAVVIGQKVSASAKAGTKAMTQTRKVTPELIERLRREQQNAWGNVTLEDIAVQCRYGEELITIELQIEPEIIMHGQADKLAPGVVYHPEYYGIAPFEHLPDIGEVIAYGINEGRVTQDIIELDDGSHVQWSVRPESIKALRRWGVV
jgi:hypothetical protein